FQSEYSLSPSRSSWSARMLYDPNGTPTSFRMPTTAAENPHWGIDGLPFMNSITRSLAMVSAIRLRSSSVMASSSRLFSPVVRRRRLGRFFRSARGEREGVNRPARLHRVAERGVNHAMPLDGHLPAKRGRDHRRRPVVAGPGRVLDGHLGAG